MCETDESFRKGFVLSAQVKTKAFENGDENKLILSLPSAFYILEERRKRNKKNAFSNENALVWEGGNKTNTLARVKIFCCILVETKTDAFKNAL